MSAVPVYRQLFNKAGHRFVISITAKLFSMSHDQDKEYRREVVVSCFSCKSENVKAFRSEINIHVPGKANPAKNVVASPKLLVCLDCGLADVLLSEDELRNLKETYSSCSREVLEDMEHDCITEDSGSGLVSKST
jgi:hypothetical protein